MSDKVKKPWTDLIGFTAALAEIREGKPPHRPTLALALRGEFPIPKEVRPFLADIVEGKISPKARRKEGRQETNILEHRLESAILDALYDSHYETLKANPPKRKGGPAFLALIRTAKDAAKLGIAGRGGLPLSPRAISDRRRKSKASE